MRNETGSARDVVEREVKLVAPLELELPDLHALRRGSTAAAVEEVQTLLRAAAAALPAARVASGELIAIERARRADLRASWPAVWEAASAKRLHRWL